MFYVSIICIKTAFFFRILGLAGLHAVTGIKFVLIPAFTNNQFRSSVKERVIFALIKNAKSFREVKAMSQDLRPFDIVINS